MAIDGSLLNLPNIKEIKEEFGSVKNQHDDIVSSRCSFAYDINNELVLDAVVAPRKSCEKELAVKHLEHLNPAQDILVFDRGYPAQWLMGLLERMNFKYCFRLSTGWKKAYQLMENSSDIDWALVKGANREWGKLKTYGLPKTLEGQRLVSIQLSSGEKELLVTNLTDREEYTRLELKELYNLRWGVEEGYKSFKKILHIEHFSGRTVNAIKQDFHARVFMLNMAAMMRTQAQNTKNRNRHQKHETQLNKTQVLAKAKDFLIDLFYSKSIRKVVKQILSIIKRRTEIVRMNRSFPRPKTDSRRRFKIMNSKGI